MKRIDFYKTVKIGMLLPFLLLSIVSGCQDKQESASKVDQPEVSEPKPEKDIRVSFLAVGDNLIHGAIYLDPYHKSAKGYDFRSVYDPIKPYLKDIDIKNINQETVLGGAELGLSHYPMFNGPQEIGDAVADCGFNWISQASNHAMDAGEAAIQNQLKLWDHYPNITATGMNRNQAEADKLRIIEVKGLKFGLLNYTYGLNGLSAPAGKEYMVNLIDDDKIKSDIAKLKPHCDVILASMHWGVEYAYEENDEQRRLAQLLADEGVSVIIGSHPHVLEPVTYITAKDQRKVLVYYSLGNFLSAQDSGDTMLGGMAKWEIVKDGKTKEIRVENAELYPTVTHYNKSIQDFKVYTLKDYNDELASKHYLSHEISRQFFIDLTNQIMKQPKDIKIIYE